MVGEVELQKNRVIGIQLMEKCDYFENIFMVYFNVF